jgi:hypothetical protein
MEDEDTDFEEYKIGLDAAALHMHEREIPCEKRVNKQKPSRGIE